MRRRRTKSRVVVRRRGRGLTKFKHSDVRRAAKAAIAAGLSIARIDVDPASGRISVIPGTPEAASGNELDQWMSKNAHQTPRT